MYLSELEEIIAFIACGLILIAFGVSTYKNIKNTIDEEREKEAEKKENAHHVTSSSHYVTSSYTCNS